MGGTTLTEAELARAWNPPCSGRSAQVALNGGGVVTVHPAIVDAVRALNDVLVRHSYRTRAADTGAYVCRDKTGQPGVKSQHARKIALDINWTTNPYGRVLHTDMPRAMVDDILAIRTNNGKQVWTWGGDWSGNKDAMHYQIACSPADLATGIRGRAPGPTTDHPSDLQLALFFAKHFRLGVPDGPGVWNENSVGGADAVRFAQHGVNDWFDRWARLTGQPNPDDIPVNGVWDQRTRDAIAFMQKIQDTVEPGHGHNELGTTGPAFWESTYPTR